MVKSERRLLLRHPRVLAVTAAVAALSFFGGGLTSALLSSTENSGSNSFSAMASFTYPSFSSSTPGTYSVVVPAGITTIGYKTCGGGAGGGGGSSGAAGGNGGSGECLSGHISFPASATTTVFTVVVGGPGNGGGTGSGGTAGSGDGGGGAAATVSGAATGGGGGGASAVYITQASPLVVAGGGGGGSGAGTGTGAGAGVAGGNAGDGIGGTGTNGSSPGNGNNGADNGAGGDHGGGGTSGGGATTSAVGVGGAGGSGVNNAFEAQTSGVSVALNDVDAIDNTHIWAVGNSCTLLFSSNGTSWTQVTLSSSVCSGYSLTGIDVLDNNDAWIVGSNGTNGTVLSCSMNCNATNANWQKATSTTLPPLMSVTAGTQPNGPNHDWYIYAGGTGGNIATCQVINGMTDTCAGNTGSWSAFVPSGLSSSAVYNSISTTNGGDTVFAAGSNGSAGYLVACTEAAHAASCNTSATTTWFVTKAPTTNVYSAVDAVSVSQVYATGANGTLLLCLTTPTCASSTAGTWSSDSSGISGSATVTDIVVQSNTSAWATTSTGAIYGCSAGCNAGGITWTSQPVAGGNSASLSAVTNSDPTHAWAVGASGTILFGPNAASTAVGSAGPSGSSGSGGAGGAAGTASGGAGGGGGGGGGGCFGAGGGGGGGAGLSTASGGSGGAGGGGSSCYTSQGSYTVTAVAHSLNPGGGGGTTSSTQGSNGTTGSVAITIPTLAIPSNTSFTTASLPQNIGASTANGFFGSTSFGADETLVLHLDTAAGPVLTTSPATITTSASGSASITSITIPNTTTSGTHVIVAVGQTSGLTAASDSFTVTQAPAITSNNTTTFQTGQPGTFMVTTTGFPTPSITESTGSGQTGLPAWATFTDNGNGTATIAAATTGAAGSYTFTITASNSVSSTSQNFTLVSASGITGLAGLAFTNSTLSGGSLNCSGVGTSNVTCTAMPLGGTGSFAADVELVNSSGTAVTNNSGGSVTLNATETTVNAPGGTVTPSSLTIANGSTSTASKFTLTGEGGGWKATMTITLTVGSNTYTIAVTGN